MQHENSHHRVNEQNDGKPERAPAHPALVELARGAGEKQDHGEDHGITEVTLGDVGGGLASCR